MPFPFDTPLTPSEESRFQDWKQVYAPHDSGVDYDLRGAFKAGLTPDPQTGHWPDTYKKPNHPTFSDQSIYSSLTGTRPGTWKGNTYIPFSDTTPQPQSKLEQTLRGFVESNLGSMPSFGFQAEPKPAHQAALDRVLDIMGDPRNAWMGTGLVGGMVGMTKLPGWGAEVLRRYKLLGGTHDTLNKTLAQRGMKPDFRNSIVQDFRSATDIAAPGPQPLLGSTKWQQGHAMNIAGGYLERYGQGLREIQPTGGYPQDIRTRVSELTPTMDPIMSKTRPGLSGMNARYALENRQVARMLDEPGFGFKKAQDLPRVSNLDYYSEYPIQRSGYTEQQLSDMVDMAIDAGEAGQHGRANAIMRQVDRLRNLGEGLAGPNARPNVRRIIEEFTPRVQAANFRRSHPHPTPAQEAWLQQLEGR